ncbi:hypothetical protein VTO42DRAFT_7271 [Malbranchea cinnamomea]
MAPKVKKTTPDAACSEGSFVNDTVTSIPGTADHVRNNHQAKRDKKIKKKKSKQAAQDDTAAIAATAAVRGDEATTLTPPHSTDVARAELRNGATKLGNGPFIINGISGQSRPPNSLSQFHSHGYEARQNGVGNGLDGLVHALELPPAGNTEPPSLPYQRPRNIVDFPSTSYAVQPALEHHHAIDEDRQAAFERNGIVFGNHVDSTGTTRSPTPGQRGFHPFHQPPLQPYNHPYQFILAHPNYLTTYPYALYGAHELSGMMVPPGYPPERHAPYGYSPYMPPNYVNPPYDADPNEQGLSEVTANCAESLQGRCVADVEGGDRESQTVHGSGAEITPSTNLRRINSRVKDEAALDKAFSIANSLVHTADEDDMEPLTSFLLRAFKSGDYADYQILLDSSVNRFCAISFLAHGIFLSRSLSLRIRLQTMQRYGYPNLLRVCAGNSFVQPKAFELALLNLYGLPLVDQNQLESQSFLSLGYECNSGEVEGNIPSNYKSRMDFALCYAASGAFMSNKSILQRGIELATDAINWETIETALRFGLGASSFALLCPDEIASQPYNSEVLENGSIDGQGSVRSDSSPADSSQISPHLSSYTLNHELVEVGAPRVLHKSLEFVAENIPFDFELDCEARSTVMPDRLAESSGLASSYISTVKFGDFTPPSGNYGPETTIASAILLSLPFRKLRKLFKFMWSKGKLTDILAEAVISERERRRVRAVRAFTSKAPDKPSNCPFAEVLGWEESVKVSEDKTQYGRISIVRSWQGFYTRPLSIGPDTSPGR